MPPTADRCPDDPNLLAFHRGESPTDELDRIARHLETCELCSGKLGQLEAESDPTHDALRLRPEIPPESPARFAPTGPPTQSPMVPGYQVLGRLGAGGMSVVDKARHLRLGRLVALKRLKTDTLFDLDRFRREAEAVAALQHPNVVQIYEVGDHDGQPYLALEHVAGGSLYDFLRGRPQPARESAMLVEALAGAVEHAHLRGVVHRDLKPANILLQRSGDGATAEIEPTLSDFTPKVGDFGIAKRIEGPGSAPTLGATRPGAILGTPSYMAPEQAEGREVGPPADVYALGAILYELLTGRPPFRGDETFETLRQVVHDDPLPPSRVRPGLPRDVETICLKCLRKDPARRYGSAAELGADLRRFLDGRPVDARPAPAWEVAWKWARRRPATAAAVAVAQASLLVLALGVSWYSGRLRDALGVTRTAERHAEENARLALDAHKRLVEQVQTLLLDEPATRSLRKALLETAVSGLERVTGADSSGPRVSRAAAHRLLGEVQWELGHTRLAIDEMERCRRVALELLAAQPGLADAREHLATACRRLGSLHLHDDKPVVARRYMRESLAAAQDWNAADPDDPRTLTAVIEGYVNLGHAAHWAHDFREARAALLRGRDLSESWLASSPNDDDASRLLGQALDLLASIDSSEGDLRSAVTNSTRSLELALADERRAADRSRGTSPGGRLGRERASRSIMVSHDNLAALHAKTRDFAAARRHMHAALDRARQAVERDTEDVGRHLDLVDALYDQAAVEQAALKHADALPVLAECQSLLKRLDAEGKLSGRPMYAIERREAVDLELETCRLLPEALGDVSVIRAAPDRLAFSLARARIEVLLAGRREEDAFATARMLIEREPVDFPAWAGLARACSQVAGFFTRYTAGRPAPAIVARLVDRGIVALERVIDLGERPPTSAELLGDEQLSALRGHPGFAALLTRTPARSRPVAP